MLFVFINHSVFHHKFDASHGLYIFGRITIEGDNSSVILDGETFRTQAGSPINLRPAQPLSFVKLAA